MSEFLDGLGAIAKKITQWIPSKTESLKDKRERLLNELKIIKSKEFSASGSRRSVAINDELQQIEAKLINKASD